MRCGDIIDRDEQKACYNRKKEALNVPSLRVCS